MNTENRSTRKIEVGKCIRLIALIAIIVIVTIMNKNFSSAYNIRSMLESVGILMVISIGTTFILLIGSMDMSIGANISCCAVLGSLLLSKIGVLAFVCMILFGCAVGVLNGVLHCKLKIPSFIATLGTMSVFNSVALLMCDSVPISLPKSTDIYLEWASINLAVFPMLFIICILLLIIYLVIQKNSKFGKSCYYIGANERAAVVSGLRTDKYKILAFANMGLCCGLAAIILMARLKSGNPTVGDSYTMMSIAAVAFGGTALSGGRGGLLSTLLGCFLLIVITQSLVILGVDIYWQKIVYGAVVILALCTTVNKTDRALIIK